MNNNKKIIYTCLSCVLYYNLDDYNLIMKSINKVIKTIIFIQFKKFPFLLSKKGLLHFIGNFFIFLTLTYY